MPVVLKTGAGACGMNIFFADSPCPCSFILVGIYIYSNFPPAGQATSKDKIVIYLDNSRTNIKTKLLNRKREVRAGAQTFNEFEKTSAFPTEVGI